MSNAVNDVLLERAAFAIDYWAGTPPAEIIIGLLKTNDLEQLKRYLKTCDEIMLEQEYQPDVY